MRYFSVLILTIVLMVVLGTGYIAHSYDSPPNNPYSHQQSEMTPTPTLDPETEAAIEGISDLYAGRFADTVRETDIDGLRDLYVNSVPPLYVINKTTRGPFGRNVGINGWVGFMSSSSDYELILDIVDVFATDHIGVVVGTFVEDVSGYTVSTGTDLFTVVETPTGWKIDTMNVVSIDSTDNNDYGDAYELPNDIESVINEFVLSYNTSESDDFLNLFGSRRDHVMIITPTFDGEFMGDSHTPSGFLEIDFGAQPTLEINNIDIHVHDQYLAYITGDYQIENSTEIAAEGKVLWSLVATARQGWQITNVLFTASEIEA